MNEKAKALAEYLGEDVTESQIDNTFEADNSEWLVLTVEETEKYITERITESLWAFNAEFLKDRICAPIPVKYIKKMQEDMCENANPIFQELIVDIDEFVFDVIEVDGRGHYLASYDGEEIELEGDSNYFLAYQVN